MRHDDPNLAKVEIVAAALGSLCNELVFVGGCAAGLLLSDPAATQARLTNDVDLMPTDARILGFANRWYPQAVASARRLTLPGGPTIRLITAPHFLATKFEAFADRGNEDVLGSHDLEDIINIIDGRTELLDEIAGETPDLRSYLGQRCAALLATPDFDNYLPGLLAQDETLAQRVTMATSRLQSIVAFANP
ncbi:MAG: hypothetical protein HZB40_12020 [Rhodocyclales bacterium]|nr:hypothetical protein [Rhodocyclales bacterium]